MSRASTYSWLPFALALPFLATHCATASPPGGSGDDDDRNGLGGESATGGTDSEDTGGTGGGSGSGGSGSGGSGSGGAPTVTCDEGQVYCAGSCIVPDTLTHCGGCFRTCFGGQACTEQDEGTFACECPGDLLLCSNLCTDPLTSETFCGASGTCTGGDAGEVCGDNSVCDEGSCVCDETFTRCDGACVDTLTDPLHCTATAGECGVACDQNEVCNNGACECPAGFAVCNGACVDTDNDPNHCGGCNAAAGGAGVVCGGATPACGGGSCVSGPCDTSLTGGSSCTSVTMKTNTACATGDDYFGGTGLKCDNNNSQIPKDTALCYTITGDYEDFRCWWSGRSMTVNGQTLSCNNSGSLVVDAPDARAGGYCVYIPPSSQDGAGTDGFSFGK